MELSFSRLIEFLLCCSSKLPYFRSQKGSIKNFSRKLYPDYAVLQIFPRFQAKIIFAFFFLLAYNIERGYICLDYNYKVSQIFQAVKIISVSSLVRGYRGNGFTVKAQFQKDRQSNNTFKCKSIRKLFLVIEGQSFTQGIPFLSLFDFYQQRTNKKYLKKSLLRIITTHSFFWFFDNNLNDITSNFQPR